MPLPNFLVIGAYKSGTTSLYEYLRQHPEIFLPNVNEPSYLAFVEKEEPNNPIYNKSIKTRQEYERLFFESEKYKAIGDVSPEYMTNPNAIRNIRRLLPDVKLIAILRNPIERAYSDYLMYVRDGLEDEKNFLEALKRQRKRQEENLPTGYYIKTGFYGEQMKPYFNNFSRDKIKIYLFEELRSDLNLLLRDVFEFLGVDSTFVPKQIESFNRSGVPVNWFIKAAFRYRHGMKPLLDVLIPRSLEKKIRLRMERTLSKPPMPDEARSLLKQIYSNDVIQLEKMIQKKCVYWLQ